MALSFLTYSKKEQAPLWIRYREGKIDAKLRTQLTIETDRLVKGQIVKHRVKNSDNAKQKDVVRNKNKALDSLQIKMNEMQMTVQTALNNRDGSEIVNKEWIKSVISPDKDSDLLTTHIERFLTYKKSNVKERSYKLYSQIRKIINAYEEETNRAYLIRGVDLNFSDDFREWMQVKKGYSINSTRIHIGVLMQVLKFASKRGVSVSNNIDLFREGLKKKKTLNVYLSFEEVNRIAKLEGLCNDEDVARDWLVISCYTAQRVSDMFKFSKEAISKDGEWITVQQTKNDTSAKILVPIMPQTREILNKYNGEFPPVFEVNNYNTYLRNVKRVCKRAGLTQSVKTLGSKGKETSSEVIDKQKWEVIGSHIGRRSFATNFYGKVPTALIMSVTGHLTESSFLLYIDRERLIDRGNFMKILIKASE
tara:strand:- start:64 stop:1326 length:1263 start_codon:yes stop_codon:yes gene_type:complete